MRRPLVKQRRRDMDRIDQMKVAAN